MQDQHQKQKECLSLIQLLTDEEQALMSYMKGFAYWRNSSAAKAAIRSDIKSSSSGRRQYSTR